MARRIVPRRLGHDEEASLVEHLTELRHRLFICIFAIVPAFAIAYAFHQTLISRLMDLVPEGTPIVTLGVTEPFTTSLKVSFYAAVALVLPLLLWQAWAFLAPAVGEETQARYYAKALQLAACQPNVVGLLFFHVSDETDLDRWQSGVPDLVADQTTGA